MNSYKNLGARIGDVNDLPPELKAQLSKTKGHTFKEDIIQVLRDEYGGYATADIWISED